MDLLTQTFIVIFILLILSVSVSIVIVKNRKNKTRKDTMPMQTIQESLFDRLTKLKKQLDEGELTQKEYEDIKNRYLKTI